MVAPRRSLGSNRNGQSAKVERIYIFDAKGARYEAKLLGKDDNRDIALLQIQKASQPFPFIQLPTDKPSNLVLGGELALLGRSQAPGNLSISIGIISGLKRNSGHSMQTSALMNYGNIGGPIIDRSGRLLGMANALSPESSWRQNCGVGFYFQAHHLAEAIETLAKGKTLDPIPQPLIGVRIDSDSVTGRARVMGLSQHGPAQRAGVAVGDIIVSLNKQPIQSHLMLVDAIEQAGVNQEVELVVLRNNKEVTLTLTIQDRQDIIRAQRDARRKAREQRRKEREAQQQEDKEEKKTKKTKKTREK